MNALLQFGLTIPLQRKLGQKGVPYGEAADRRSCWDLHCIALHGKESLLAVHCSSRFTVVAYDLTAFDWANLHAFAVELIRAALLEEGLTADAVSHYLERADSAAFTRTHGRREVAFLNRAWDDVLALDFAVDASQSFQPLLNQAVNSRLCRCAGWGGVAAAAEFLRKDFAEDL